MTLPSSVGSVFLSLITKSEYLYSNGKIELYNLIDKIMKDIQSTDPQIYNAIIAEQQRQSEGMELIASENYQSPAVLETQSSVFANKYSE